MKDEQWKCAYVAKAPVEDEETAETDDEAELDATELEDAAPARQEVSLLAPTVIYGSMLALSYFTSRQSLPCYSMPHPR